SGVVGADSRLVGPATRRVTKSACLDPFGCVSRITLCREDVHINLRRPIAAAGGVANPKPAPDPKRVLSPFVIRIYRLTSAGLRSTGRGSRGAGTTINRAAKVSD